MFISEMFQFLLFLLYDIVILKTERVNCKCGKPLKQKSRGREGTTMSLYTRDGVIEASHLEFRCSAASRSKNEHCKSGYYYGYYSYNRELYFNEDALTREYLITSRKTGFSIKLLWEWTLSFLFEQCTFESMAKKYTAFHLGGYEDDELKNVKESQVCIQ